MPVCTSKTKNEKTRRLLADPKESTESKEPKPMEPTESKEPKEPAGEATAGESSPEGTRCEMDCGGASPMYTQGGKSETMPDVECRRLDTGEMAWTNELLGLNAVDMGSLACAIKGGCPVPKITGITPSCTTAEAGSKAPAPVSPKAPEGGATKAGETIAEGTRCEMDCGGEPPSYTQGLKSEPMHAIECRLLKKTKEFAWINELLSPDSAIDMASLACASSGEESPKAPPTTPPKAPPVEPPAEPPVEDAW
jgi:hypothetical protein